MECSNFPIKILSINFDNFISDNTNWDKISLNIAKKKKNPYLEQNEPLLRGKDLL